MLVYQRVAHVQNVQTHPDCMPWLCFSYGSSFATRALGVAVVAQVSLTRANASWKIIWLLRCTLWLWLTVRHGFSMALIEIDDVRDKNLHLWLGVSMANWQCHNQMVYHGLMDPKQTDVSQQKSPWTGPTFCWSGTTNTQTHINDTYDSYDLMISNVIKT